MGRLTHRRKQLYFPVIVERDGYCCFYCNQKFNSDQPAEWDHLNNDPDDTRPENLVFTHHKCNIKKKFNSDWQIKAHDKLLRNEKALLVSERTRHDAATIEQLTSSQSISKALRPIVEQWLEEYLFMENELILKDAVNAMVHFCQHKVGWGSQATIYRYIEELTNPYNGKYTLSKNDSSHTIIRRRTEN